MGLTCFYPAVGTKCILNWLWKSELSTGIAWLCFHFSPQTVPISTVSNLPRAGSLEFSCPHLNESKCLPSLSKERGRASRGWYTSSQRSLCHLRVFKMKPLGMSKSFTLKAGRRERRREDCLSCGVFSVEKQRIFHSEISIHQKMACFPAKSTLVKMD